MCSIISREPNLATAGAHLRDRHGSDTIVGERAVYVSDRARTRRWGPVSRLRGRANAEPRRKNRPPLSPGQAKRRDRREPIGKVDCVELRWWFGIPRPGHRTMRGSYDADTLELAWVIDMEATGPARVRGVDCVRIRADEWSAECGRKTQSLVFYVRVEEDAESRWVAVLSDAEGKKDLFTFLDEEFESQWGTSANPARGLYDDGRYRPQPGGSYETTGGIGLGAGTYDFTIGWNSFRCLRVLEPDLSEPGGGELTEA
jgi:hypothetical protein